MAYEMYSRRTMAEITASIYWLNQAIVGGAETVGPMPFVQERYNEVSNNTFV